MNLRIILDHTQTMRESISATLRGTSILTDVDLGPEHAIIGRARFLLTDWADKVRKQGPESLYHDPPPTFDMTNSQDVKFCAVWMAKQVAKCSHISTVIVTVEEGSTCINVNSTVSWHMKVSFCDEWGEHPHSLTFS
jgi:hypothetical protein